jgi:hypothetical protein
MRELRVACITGREEINDAYHLTVILEGGCASGRPVVIGER